MTDSPIFACFFTETVLPEVMNTISAEAKDLGARARARKLKPEEYTGSTFSVSNLGMMGIDEFSAVINPPEGAILAVGAVVEKPVVADGRVEVGTRCRMTLSSDHRVVDEAPPVSEPTTASVRNGPAVAAIVAAGIGSACLGIIVTAEGAFADFSRALNIVNPVGPLSGKTTLMVALWLVAWGVLHLAWRSRDVNFPRAATATGILLVLGLLGTFPPMFDLIGSLIEHH